MKKVCLNVMAIIVSTLYEIIFGKSFFGIFFNLSNIDYRQIFSCFSKHVFMLCKFALFTIKRLLLAIIHKIFEHVP